MSYLAQGHRRTIQKLFPITTFVFLFFVPLLTFAQQGVFKILDIFQNNLFSSFVGIIITLGLVYFLWGVSKFVGAGGDESSRTEGRQMMIHGIIALFVMVSVWGLVQIIVDTFSITEKAAPFKPGVF